LANTAIRPDFIVNRAVDEKVKATGASEEEMHLYNLSRHKGWLILETYMDDQVRSLESINAQAIEKGLTFEEIGKNAIVINLAKDFVRRITDRVNDAKEVVENPDGTIRQ